MGRAVQITPTPGRPGGFRWGAIAPLIGVVSLAALIIVPVPTPVVDALITLNLAAAIVLLLAALSAQSIKSLSALPGLLLLTTLFRLALNVSTTRLILVQADAGGVVQAFGEFVVGGSYLVCGVVFAILTVVQYLVIASGAGRVAEVAARFALDALPGAQAAIDADLRSGAIGRPEAERRRQELTTESRLFGALDGAMKFVRGDAIAALVITAFNLLGGIAVGAMTQDMPASEALRTYGLLTIGDGLAAQIPAVLVSVAAGLAVTRVDDPSTPGTLPEAAARQLSRTPAHIVGAGGLLIALGLIPGLPTAPFVAMGAGTALLGWVLSRQFSAEEAQAAWLTSPTRLELQIGPDLLRSAGGVSSVAALVDAASVAAADPVRWPAPAVSVRGVDGLGPDAWRLDLDGARAAGGVLDPSTPTASSEALKEGVGAVVAALLPELVDVQATSDLVDALAETHPALTRESLSQRLSLPELTQLVALLMAEGLPAGDLRAVLEAVLSLPGEPSADAAATAEAIRPRFRRQLTALASDGRPDGVLEGYTLDESLLYGFEGLSSRKPDPADPADRTARPATPLGLREELHAACAASLGTTPSPRPLLFVPRPLRHQVKAALGASWHHVMVLSEADLDPGLTVEPAGAISAPGGLRES